MDRLFGARRVAELRQIGGGLSVTGRCVEEFELAPGTRECSRRFALAPAVSPIGRSAPGEPIRAEQWTEWSGSSLGQILLSC
jgi:hypothetical protein